MANVQRNFVAGKMNKSLDERLLPNGQYIDAINVRLGSTEASEIGAVENSKGNESLTTLLYNGVELSSDARCIGAFALGEQETMYWFVHDPSFTLGATGKCDMIVSFETKSEILTYHIISLDDGGGVNTTLNFKKEELMLGVDFVGELLFFTDNFNPPRFINVNRNYVNPTPAFVDQFSAEAILVIKRPPYTSPLIEPKKGAGENNYLENRFVSFGYRYRYADNEYSATSPFSAPSFIPGPFNYSSGQANNQGMLNTTNICEITYNSGGELVVGVDLLFKDISTNVIKVIEKLNKSDLGIANNTESLYTFSNSKIFTVLADTEILRLFDNVPLKAKAQTLMGNRLMYGNYFEGRDLIDYTGEPLKLEYNTELISEAVEFRALEQSKSSGQYTISGTTRNITDVVVEVDFTGAELVQGAGIAIELDLIHDSWDASFDQLTETNDAIQLNFQYRLRQAYNNIFELAQDQDFIDAIQLLEPVFLDACDGTSLTDELNCAAELVLDINYQKQSSGITGINQPFEIIVSPTEPDTLKIQINALQYVDQLDPTNVAYEYLTISLAEAEYTKIANATSLHSNRGYEVGIIYMDEFSRATTALVSENNTQYVPCGNLTDQNTIQVKIPTTQLPPAWAKYYKFCIKPDKENYDIIYSNLFFRDASLGSTWFLLNGENSQKIEIGDKLLVKADTNGPKQRCTTVTVLDKDAKLADFIQPPPADVAGNEAVVPSGTYMRIATNRIATSLGENPVIEDDKSGRNGTRKSCPKVTLDVCSLPNPDFDVTTYDPLDPATFAFLPFEIPEGSTIQINYFNKRNGASGGNQCELRECVWEAEVVASEDYSSLKAFWDGDNIGGLTSTAECRTDTSDSPSEFEYLPAIGGFNTQVVFGTTITVTSLPCALGFNYIQFLDYAGTDDTLSGKQVLGFTGTKGCGKNRNRRSTLEVEVSIIRSDALIVFESEPQDALPDLWYESPTTFKISNEECEIKLEVDAAEPSPIVFDYDIEGVTTSVTVNPGAGITTVYGDCNSAVVSPTTPPSNIANITIGYTTLSGPIHEGNVQNQTDSVPAIIDTEFFNCYTFGNGVESFKIEDSIVGKPLTLGNRVTSTSAQDYKQAHRFADITYSGVFNDETNLNKLNEFNLGLLNFKPLEDSYGPITVLDGRETDILTLQEDKISYVLQGKNLLSDSTGGGAVTSVPEVLGTQIARIEDYGNSNNPESYAVWGADKFFTDSKRGAVIQLKGSSAQSEQLQVISEFGMRSFFRDLFIEDFNTFKLGGYDPYMNEYVLTNSNIKIPQLPQEINCGISRTITLNGESEQFIYQLGNLVGPVTVSFFVTDYSGVDIPYTGTYNGAVVFSGNITSDGLVSITFDKNIVSEEELIVNFGAYVSSSSTLVEITVNCPDAPTITIIQVAITSNNEEGQFVHNEYRWLDGTFTSALQSEQIEFNSGTGLIVSQYTSTSAPQGGNLIPANGATVRIISNKISALGDDFIFNPALNKFKYHRGSTLYTNTPTQIQALLNVATTSTPISGAAPTYQSNFPMPNTSDEFLYLIWDYREPTPIELCFSDVSCEEACCDCDPDPEPTDNLLVELCYDSLSTTTSPLTEVIPPTSGVTVGSFVNLTINPSCTYVVTAVTQASVTDTVSNIEGTKTDCSQVCDQYQFSADGLSSGTYSYVDCLGAVQNGTVPAGQSIQVCANSISTLTNITATHFCGCSLNLIVERCQEPNTGTPDTQIISFDGESIGQLVNLTGGAFIGCKYEIVATTLDPVTASKGGNESGQCCNAYFVENITATTKLFSYVDCFNIAQSFNITAGGVQIVCLQDFTQEPLNFSVTFQTCDCTPT
tara:strand:- start:2820 stop:8312 length:5493 start_codon:yes stop_codon:yes gene_type:complete